MSHAVKIYKIFEGVLPSDKAEEFVGELEGIQESTLTQTLKTLVAKEDLATTKEDLGKEIVKVREDLRREIGEVKEELGKEIVKVREDLTKEIGKLDVRITDEIGRLNVRITDEIGRLGVRIAEARADIIKWMFLFWIGQVASILAILKIARVF